MVYSNKCVACVLLNGEPQPELANGTVKLPFGADYELRFRNKNNRRAVVKIYIDGENVSGNGYIVPANGHVDIKRHHDVDRAFKFVSLDSGEAVEHGKNGPNPDKIKGTIEARFYLEKERSPVTTVNHHHYYPRPRPWVYPQPPYIHWTNMSSENQQQFIRGMKGHDPSNEQNISMTPKGLDRNERSITGSGAPAPLCNYRSLSQNCCSPASSSSAQPILHDGCTVEGDLTGQTFLSTHIDTEDAFTSIKIFLQGYDPDVQQQVVAKPHKKPAKNKELADLESENEELRRQLAEAENAILKSKLENVKKPAKRKASSKGATK